MRQRDIVKLSAETDVSLNTVRRWAKGERVNDPNRRALENAAKVLGIDTQEDDEK